MLFVHYNNGSRYIRWTEGPSKGQFCLPLKILNSSSELDRFAWDRFRCTEDVHRNTWSRFYGGSSTRKQYKQVAGNARVLISFLELRVVS